MMKMARLYASSMWARLMSKVIGLDPDCVKSGFAVYEDGKLTGLLNLTIPEYIEMLPILAEEGAEIAIEDSSLNKFIYTRNSHAGDTIALKMKRAMDVGRVQQQSIIMGDLAEAYGLKVTRYKPCAGNWQSSRRKDSKNGEIFRKASGWEGRSNAETRSAAYFGYKHLKTIK